MTFFVVDTLYTHIVYQHHLKVVPCCYNCSLHLNSPCVHLLAKIMWFPIDPHVTVLLLFKSSDHASKYLVTIQSDNCIFYVDRTAFTIREKDVSNISTFSAIEIIIFICFKPLVLFDCIPG